MSDLSHAQKRVDFDQELIISSFHQLESLFVAIREGSRGNDHVANLANVGQYLCDDWRRIFVD